VKIKPGLHSTRTHTFCMNGLCFYTEDLMYRIPGHKSQDWDHHNLITRLYTGTWILKDVLSLVFKELGDIRLQAERMEWAGGHRAHLTCAPPVILINHLRYLPIWEGFCCLLQVTNIPHLCNQGVLTDSKGSLLILIFMRRKLKLKPFFFPTTVWNRIASWLLE
jgi:hypothetical protein